MLKSREYLIKIRTIKKNISEGRCKQCGKPNDNLPQLCCKACALRLRQLYKQRTKRV